MSLQGQSNAIKIGSSDSKIKNLYYLSYKIKHSYTIHINNC